MTKQQPVTASEALKGIESEEMNTRVFCLDYDEWGTIVGVHSRPTSRVDVYEVKLDIGSFKWIYIDRLSKQFIEQQPVTKEEARKELDMITPCIEHNFSYNPIHIISTFIDEQQDLTSVEPRAAKSLEEIYGEFELSFTGKIGTFEMQHCINFISDNFPKYANYTKKEQRDLLDVIRYKNKEIEDLRLALKSSEESNADIIHDKDKEIQYVIKMHHKDVEEKDTEIERQREIISELSNKLDSNDIPL